MSVRPGGYHGAPKEPRKRKRKEGEGGRGGEVEPDLWSSMDSNIPAAAMSGLVACVCAAGDPAVIGSSWGRKRSD